jgi:HSP20 family protein
MNKQTEKTREYVDYTPAADIIDMNNAIKLYLDMPGANKDCLNINIDDHVLSVTADTGLIYGDKSLRYSRSFSVSDEIDTKQISANINDGILEMVLPIAESAKPFQIPVAG